MTESEKTNKPEEWHILNDSDSHDDPLLDCLVILAKMHERPISKTILRAGLPLVKDKLTVELVSRSARRAGLSSRILKRPLNEFNTYELPAILLLENRRACIAVKAFHGDGTLEVIWPESQGTQIISCDKLSSAYTGYAIFIKPKYRIDVKGMSHPEDRTKNWFWVQFFLLGAYTEMSLLPLFSSMFLPLPAHFL